MKRDYRDIEWLRESGVEIEECERGWAVYEMVNDDVTHFVAVFVDEERAREFAQTLWDGDVVPAILPDGGIATSNDVGVTTHEALGAVLARGTEADA